MVCGRKEERFGYTEKSDVGPPNVQNQPRLNLERRMQLSSSDMSLVLLRFPIHNLLHLATSSTNIIPLSKCCRAAP